MTIIDRIAQRLGYTKAEGTERSFLPDVPPVSGVAEIKSTSTTDVTSVASGQQVLRLNRYPTWINVHDAPDEKLRACIWVYVCATIVADAVASVPLKVVRNGEEVPDTHPLRRLLSKPAPDYDTRMWMQEASLAMTLTGTLYVEKVRARAMGRSKIAEGGLPKELWPQHGQTFRPVKQLNTRRPKVEQYQPLRGEPGYLPAVDVVPVRYVRPGRPTEGFSPYEGAAREISIDRAASEWQQISLANFGVPTGIFKSKVPLDEEQHAEAEAHVQEKMVGARNARKTFLIGEDVEWLQLAQSLVDLDFQSGRRFTKSGVAAAMNVPLVLIDVEGATFANYQTGEMILWTRTVLPQAGQIVAGINRGVVPEYGERGLEVVIDHEQIDAMLPLINAKWDLAGKQLNAGVPMEQVARRLRLGVEAYPDWDKPLVPGSLRPLAVVTAETPGSSDG